MLEELQRQRVQGGGGTSPLVVTCPNEMVALSAAQGYAQATGKPAAVIIHVDVGTQALAGAIHNVDRGRVPVLIYAGASPFTSRNEMKGARNEWIMWLQDIPDQSAIVRQYMRYTAQINTGRNIVQVVKRALQIATTEPQGPVYLWARREVMEEEIPPALFDSLTMKPAISVSPAALSHFDALAITNALLTSLHPLIITSHLGRNPDAVASLVTLSTLLAIPIFSTCPSTVNVPFSHPYLAGITYITPTTTDSFRDHLRGADVVLVLDSDVPWIPSRCAPKEDGSASVFIIDGGDPLKTSVAMGTWDAGLHRGVELICRADAETAIGQIVELVRENVRGPTAGIVTGGGNGRSFEALSAALSERIMIREKEAYKVHEQWVKRLDEAEAASSAVVQRPEGGISRLHVTVPHLMRTLRDVTSSISSRSLIVSEAISNYGLVWEHAHAEHPGSVLTSGGASLGYALGASVGAILGDRARDGNLNKYDLVTAIVGDGSFMFGVPSSAYWIARRYEAPFLTIILNNGGWKSPKLSMLGVHPQGHGSNALSGEQLSVGFGFQSDSSNISSSGTSSETNRISPNYAQIAVAATDGWAWGKKVSLSHLRSQPEAATPEQILQELRETLSEAARVVLEEKRCAVVDCVLEAL
ncbi:hypothetical protein D9757_010595 [Collybiopsis confluens]|uniref:Uncharacterized protein n=1 Tax=Collybiopsis confluens TaxID=2823264 RepID=A0A8H5GVT2_9AGAR|nr:hypothetical protein D9757_010595 [Collybiopsis confluens]